MKDRMAVSMVDAAERSSKLRPGGAIIEATAETGPWPAKPVCIAPGISHAWAAIRGRREGSTLNSLATI